MARPPDPSASRRQFIRTATRSVVACALTAATAGLIGKHGTAGLTCINSGRCRGCSILRSCRLPAAQTAQSASGERR